MAKQHTVALILNLALDAGQWATESVQMFQRRQISLDPAGN